MLAYAFEVLRQPHYGEIAAEDFENVHDLLAAILAKGVLKQLKQGRTGNTFVSTIISLFCVEGLIYTEQLIIGCRENNCYTANTRCCPLIIYLTK